ncbi:hypothetical protein H5V45_05400 [Nocardioides sp. KIGAM211]|uniref:Uncharacterized protein n=1 Tax=Nocardioides luti TaxID=2761101 RepID=A0A7X0RED7_9ACTN|nr:hypothetical protein [Nocardioides luti]MBB6626754.1 hypothetical protein [Nocardioides luti]
MFILDATTISFFVVTVLALAAVGAVVALAAVAEFVVSNRRTRVARHQTVRTYYRGLALSH